MATEKKIESEDKKILKFFSLKRVLIPVVIGLCVACYFIITDLQKPVFVKVEAGKGTHVWHDTNDDAVLTIDELTAATNAEAANYIIQTPAQVWQKALKGWTWNATFAIFMALVMVCMRDLAYMYRIRLLTDRQLSWKQSFQVIILWEFSSALTPSVVGGSAVAFFILAQEKISAGRSTAIVMITALLDEMFYIISVPLAFLLAGTGNLFVHNFDFKILGYTLGMQTIFFVGFGFICLLTCIILFAILIKPVAAKRIIVGICTLKPLRKYLRKAIKMGDDIIVTSNYLKNKSVGFWLKAFGSTFFSWTARFSVVNFLIMAFNSGADQLLVYARQLIMWVILLISPTPGGSGIAEFAFPIFLQEFIPGGIAPILALLWRILTYYPYLIAGVIVLPIWFRRILKNRRTSAAK